MATEALNLPDDLPTEVLLARRILADNPRQAGWCAPYLRDHSLPTALEAVLPASPA
jgi:hypothetical protein